MTPQRPRLRGLRVARGWAVPYWILVGALVAFGVAGMLTIGLAFLLVGLTMVALGVRRPSLRNSSALFTLIGVAAVARYVIAGSSGYEGSSGSGWGEAGPTSEVTIEFTHVDGWAPHGGGISFECPEVHTSDDADMTRACEILESLPPAAFGNVDGQLGCSLRPRGLETAHLTGTIRGRAVDAHFDRSNGCNNERWMHIAPLIRAVTSPPRESR